MALEIKAFKCEFCIKKVLETKSGIKRHESKCFYNPAAKACITCGHFKKGEVFTHEELSHKPTEWVGRSCECGKNIKFNLENNCLSWILKNSVKQATR